MLRCSKAKGLKSRREADGTNALERPGSVRGRRATLGVEGSLVLAAILIGLNFVAKLLRPDPCLLRDLCALHYSSTS
jgi:hypothetical protein